MELRRVLFRSDFSTNVAILKIFPGLQKCVIDAIINTPGLRAIVLESFGSGNAPTQEWFLDTIKSAIDKDILIVNISQCLVGSVDMDAYATGVQLKKMGVISGYDSTTEAALTKFFFLMGQNTSNEIVKDKMQHDLRGEITIFN